MTTDVACVGWGLWWLMWSVWGGGVATDVGCSVGGCGYRCGLCEVGGAATDPSYLN